MFGIEWLLTGAVTQLVLAIISKDARIPLERWVFDINVVEPSVDSAEPYVRVFFLQSRCTRPIQSASKA